MKNMLSKCNSSLKVDKIDGVLAVLMICYDYIYTQSSI